MELVKPKKSGFDLDAIRADLGDDWPAVNQLIFTKLESDVALVNSVARYIVRSGGKRLRPLLVLLAARACGYRGDKHILAAVIIEFIHTATLLHDDVVDESALRRGQETANEVFGNQRIACVASRVSGVRIQVEARRLSVYLTASKPERVKSKPKDMSFTI